MRKNHKVDIKTVMLKHSKAKVDLYANYLSRYLNILSRAGFFDKIHIYDLMCGEGIYSDGSKGSPVIALEKIKEHFFSNNKTCPNIEVWFNDNGKSEIDKGKYKIERVQECCSNLFVPETVEIIYRKEDYVELYPQVLHNIKSLRNERMLLFIDPYGYKEFKLEHLKNYLCRAKTELILFLPISHMYRFASKSITDDGFTGGEPLKEFLTPLFNERTESIDSPDSFVNQLKISFREYLKEQEIFVDTFTIERDVRNLYCLFFFTPHIKGFEVMLETKWKMDEGRGKGFERIPQKHLFSKIQDTNYSQLLQDYISQEGHRTNGELYRFGLDNGFLPKHTVEVFKDWQKNNSKFKVYQEDGQEARKGAFYIKSKNYGKTPKEIVKYKFE